MLPPAHVSNDFHFVIHAPLSRAATFFGPEAERCWAGPHWNPDFLYPQPGKDIQGAVFRVRQGQAEAVWVNTLFDVAGGRMQYVSFAPASFVSTVDVRLTLLTQSTTSVEVTYARTALHPTANDTVEALGRNDRESGPHWQQAIESCLEEQRKNTPE